MASRSLRLVCDTENGRLVPGFRSIISTVTPKFVVGDEMPLEVFLCRQIQGSGYNLQEVPFPAGSVLRVAVGEVNQTPTSGSWTLTFDGDTTADLAYNATAAQVETALNNLASITSAGGVQVSKVGDTFSIEFNNTGDQPNIYGTAETLVPLSSVSVQTLQEGSATEREVVYIQVKVRPIAFTETFTDLAAPVISRVGQTYSIAGAVKSGSYKLQVTYSANTVQTVNIPYNASTGVIEDAIKTALVSVNWPVGGQTRPVQVVQTDSQSWAVSYWDGGNYLTGVDGSNLAGFAGKAGTLSFNTPEALAFIGSETNKRAVLELEIEVDDKRQTLAQATVDINGDLILAGAFEPSSLSEAMSETVANARFVRRDQDQTLDATSKDQIWENLLGSTAVTGVNLVDAILSSNGPNSSNPLATLGDLAPAYDQSLNTTDSVAFAALTISGETKTGSLKVTDGTTDFLTINAAGELTTTAAANLVNVISTGGTYSITGSGMDTVLGFDYLSFQGVNALTPSDLFLDGGLGTVALNPTALTFSGGTSLSASVLSITDGLNSTSLDLTNGLTFVSTNAVSDINLAAAAVLHSGGGGHIDANNYPDEIRITLNGVTYAVPARAI